uniref:L domain-like protein n=1 Tax=Strongyloides papillosus TaxID=174720 RepID=A0A0N5BG02_STREA
MLCSINIIEDSTSQKYEDFYVYLISFEETFDNKSSEEYWGLGLKKFEPAVPSDDPPIHNIIEKMNIYQKDTNKRIYQELDIIPITPNKIGEIRHNFDSHPSLATIVLTSPNKTINIINYDYEDLERFVENLSAFKSGNLQSCNSEKIKFKMKNEDMNDTLNDFFDNLVDIYINTPYSSDIIKLFKNAEKLKKVVIKDMFRYDKYFGYTYQKCSHLPETVKKFKKLVTLDLSGNYLWNLPEIVTLFPNLEKLILNDLVEPMIIVPVKLIKPLRNVSIEYSIFTLEACDDTLLLRNAEMACRLYCDCHNKKNPFKRINDDDDTLYQSWSKECIIDSTGECSEDDNSSSDDEDVDNTFTCDGCHNKCSKDNHECFFVWGPIHFFSKNIILKSSLQNPTTKVLYVYQLCEMCKIGFSGNEYSTLEKDYGFDNDV